MKNVREGAEKAPPSLQPHISDSPAAYAKSLNHAGPPGMKLDAIVVADVQLTNRNSQHFQDCDHYRTRKSGTFIVLCPLTVMEVRYKMDSLQPILQGQKLPLLNER